MQRFGCNVRGIGNRQYSDDLDERIVQATMNGDIHKRQYHPDHYTPDRHYRELSTPFRKRKGPGQYGRDRQLVDEQPESIIFIIAWRQIRMRRCFVLSGAIPDQPLSQIRTGWLLP
jgi:hypothetical protein